MGLRDDPLNATGLKQAEQTAKELACVAFSHLYVSPLLRARQTAEAVVKWQRESPNTIIDSAWRERDFGEFEGFQKTPSLRCALEQSLSVESNQSLRQRLNSAMARIAQHNEPVLVISHSAVFRMLIKDMEYRSEPKVLRLDNAQCARLLPKSTSGS